MTDREAIDVLFNEWKCIDRNDGIHCDRKCESCDLVMDVGIIREAFNMAISALQEQELKQEVKNLKESSLTQKKLDTISRQAALETVRTMYERCDTLDMLDYCNLMLTALKELPSAQPEPLSDAYTKAVWTWLLDYQIKVAKLKGRYTPYEVLSWVANDWRKEHEGSD
jgi:hypothetical protein